MSKFKVGDRVRVARLRQEDNGPALGSCGVVFHIDDTADHLVELDNDFYGYHSGVQLGAKRGWWFYENDIELIDVKKEEKSVSKVKVGDRVRVTNGYSGPKAGSLGTVRSVQDNVSDQWCAVEFDEPFPLAHGCDDGLKNGYILNFSWSLEVVVQNPKVGDWIEVTGNGYKEGEVHPYTPPPVGSRGIVRSFSDDRGTLRVEFPDGKNMHDCHWKGMSGENNWFVGGAARTYYKIVDGPGDKPVESEKARIVVTGPTTVLIDDVPWTLDEIDYNLDAITEELDERAKELESCKAGKDNCACRLADMKAASEALAAYKEPAPQIKEPAPQIKVGDWVRVKDSVPLEWLRNRVGRVFGTRDGVVGSCFNVEFPEKAPPVVWDMCQNKNCAEGRGADVYGEYLELAD